MLFPRHRPLAAGDGKEPHPLAFPRALVPLRDVSASWFNTFRKASLSTGLTAHTVSGRLYCSREHAMKYQAAGLRRIRAAIV